MFVDFDTSEANMWRCTFTGKPIDQRSFSDFVSRYEAALTTAYNNRSKVRMLVDIRNVDRLPFMFVIQFAFVMVRLRSLADQVYDVTVVTASRKETMQNIVNVLSTVMTLESRMQVYTDFSKGYTAFREQNGPQERRIIFCD